MFDIPFPVGIYMFKVNSGNTRTRCEIYSKITIKTPERRHWRRSGVFIVNFEHISYLVLVFLLLTLSRQMPTGLFINLFIPLIELKNIHEKHQVKEHTCKCKLDEITSQSPSLEQHMTLAKIRL